MGRPAPSPPSANLIAWDALERALDCPAWSIVLFASLCVVYATLQIVQRLREAAEEPPVKSNNNGAAKNGHAATGTNAEYRAFQWRWGMAYCTIMLADWLQGTHMYALYASYELSKDDIGNLFLTGFGSGAVFSTVIGPFVDRFGRKNGCLLYCVLEVRHELGRARPRRHD